MKFNRWACLLSTIGGAHLLLNEEISLMSVGGLLNIFLRRYRCGVLANASRKQSEPQQYGQYRLSY